MRAMIARNGMIPMAENRQNIPNPMPVSHSIFMDVFGGTPRSAAERLTQLTGRCGR
jgi:hypothetical protein